MHTILNEAVVYWIHLPEHTDISTQGYVGVTKDLPRRKLGHFRELVAGVHANTHLTHAFKKYSWEKMIVDVFMYGEDNYCYEVEARLRPTKAIGWNISPGGHRGPGWPKGRKKSKASIAAQKATTKKRHGKAVAERRAEKARLRAEELAENKRIREERRETKKQEHKAEVQRRRDERIRLKDEHEEQLAQAYYKTIQYSPISVPDTFKIGDSRPICAVCNQRPRAINCYRGDKVYYRNRCWACIRKNKKKKIQKARWELAGYKKKTVCDRCGFRSKFAAQLLVYHTDGDLNNTNARNLKTICLNCVVEVKKTDAVWRPGDLTPDF